MLERRRIRGGRVGDIANIRGKKFDMTKGGFFWSVYLGGFVEGF